jgi:hypothetical protein
MKILTTLIILAGIILLSEARAENHCEMPNWEERYFCVVAGGSANTELAMNSGHARSMALKTARILAYEKMAEKIKGVLITSQSKLGNESLSSSQVNTAIKAKLHGINFEKETVEFLQDGSPWAEVTVSILRFDKMKRNKALHFEGGSSKNLKTESAVSKVLIIDLKGQGFKNIASPKIRNSERNSLVFSSDMLPTGSRGVQYYSDLEEIHNRFPDQEYVLIKGLVKNGEILVDSNEAQTIKKLDFENKIFSDEKIVFINERQ